MSGSYHVRTPGVIWSQPLSDWLWRYPPPGTRVVWRVLRLNTVLHPKLTHTILEIFVTCDIRGIAAAGRRERVPSKPDDA